MSQAIYQSKQTSWFVWLIIVFGGAGIASLYMVEMSDKERLPSAILIAVFCLAIFLLFSKLESTVYTDRIEIKFGVGIIKKTILFSEIETIEKVTNKFWYGWGIRLTPHGWLWNISGYQAVQFNLKGKTKGFRLGCSDHGKMAEAIQSQL